MQAKPKLEVKDFRSIVDENLDSNSISEEQVERMILAAKLCLTQSSRLRPNIRQVKRKKRMVFSSFFFFFCEEKLIMSLFLCVFVMVLDSGAFNWEKRCEGNSYEG